MRLLRREATPASGMARRGACLALTLAVCLAAGCSPLLLLTGTDGDRPLRAQRDIAYGPLHRQRLDIYALESAASNRPVIVFFYGGAWQRGERWKYRFVGEALAADGAVAVVPDYRLYPEVRFPSFVRDGARGPRPEGTWHPGPTGRRCVRPRNGP
jgi:acetyl esterase/lipase